MHWRSSKTWELLACCFIWHDRQSVAVAIPVISDLPRQRCFDAVCLLDVSQQCGCCSRWCDVIWCTGARSLSVIWHLPSSLSTWFDTLIAGLVCVKQSCIDAHPFYTYTSLRGSLPWFDVVHIRGAHECSALIAPRFICIAELANIALQRTSCISLTDLMTICCAIWHSNAS